jgi:hypothetical protein
MTESKDLAVTSDALTGVDLDILEQQLNNINAVIDKALATANEYDVTDEALREMTLKDIKKIEQSGLSALIKEVDAARKEFKTTWQAPLNMVEDRIKDAIEPVKALHAKYKDARTTKEQEAKDERYANLRSYWLDSLAANGAESIADMVSFEQILDNKWLNASTSEVKAYDGIDARVAEIVTDWNNLKAAQWHYPTDAELTYFKTLSLSEVMQADAAKYEEEQRLAALKAEQEQAAAYREPEPLPEPEPQPEPAYMLAPEPEVPAEPVFKLTFTATMTATQWEGLKAYMQAAGIHGQAKKEQL